MVTNIIPFWLVAYNEFTTPKGWVLITTRNPKINEYVIDSNGEILKIDSSYLVSSFSMTPGHWARIIIRNWIWLTRD